MRGVLVILLSLLRHATEDYLAIQCTRFPIIAFSRDLVYAFPIMLGLLSLAYVTLQVYFRSTAKTRSILDLQPKAILYSATLDLYR